MHKNQTIIYGTYYSVMIPKKLPNLVHKVEGLEKK